MAGSSPEEVVVTSPTVESESTPKVETSNSDASATSSSAQKPAETLLDRIQSVIKKPEGSPASEKSGSQADADPASNAKAEDSLELSPDEAKTLHPKTQERFGKLTSRLKAKDTEIADLKPKAAEFDKIDTFIRQAGLSSQDVGSTLQIASLLRSNPEAARERLRPIMAELDRMLGETLPAELQARVDQGYLTMEDAKALNRAAASAALSTKRATDLEQRQQQEDASRSQQAEVNSTLSAIDVWEKQKAKGDPDWHQKQAEVSELVELAIERKTRELKRPWFPNPEEAVKLSEDALKTVGERYKRFTPKPRAIDPPVTAGASPRSTPVPKNTMDIIRQNVNRAPV